VDVLKKATENWNKNSESATMEKTPGLSTEVSEEQPYIKIVLKMLALKGDAGMLIQSIADALDVGSNQIKSSLAYLEKNKFIESVSSSTGTKYYLIERGKNYCIKKGYISA
jgi:predicted ArsR family transcriptional regulator